MALKAAFIFLAPSADAQNHRCQINTPEVNLTVVGTSDYASAEAVAKELTSEGIVAIELCGGFGHVGTSRIVQAVEGKAQVGVVRFDVHPGLEGKTGDEIF